MTSIFLHIALLIFPFVVIAVAMYMRKNNYEEWLIRKLFHVLSIMTVSLYVTLIPFIEGLTIVLIFLGILILLSFTRLRMLQIIFEMSTRKGEGQGELVVNNILTTTVLTILYFVMEVYPYIFLTAALAVSFGDGLGELIGRPLGKHKFKILAEKSVEGSFGVFVGTFLGGILSFFLLSTITSWILVVILIVSAIVVIIEAVSISFMDNILIPGVVAGVMYLLL